MDSCDWERKHDDLYEEYCGMGYTGSYEDFEMIVEGGELDMLDEYLAEVD